MVRNGIRHLHTPSYSLTDTYLLSFNVYFIIDLKLWYCHYNLEVGCKNKLTFDLSPRVAFTPYGAHYFRAKNAHWCHRAHIDSFPIGSKNFRKNWYQRVFRVAEYKFWDFRSLRLRIDTQNSKIQDGVSNMADQDVKIYFIEMKIITRWFSRSLITYIYSEFFNPIWRTKV